MKKFEKLKRLPEKTGEPCRIRTCDPLIKSKDKAGFWGTDNSLKIPYNYL